MKIYSILCLPLIFFSCSTLQSIEETPDCPKGYDCTTEVIQGKSITLHEDTIGKLYIKMVDNEDYNLIKYSYNYEGRPELADDSYNETILFEIPKDKDELSLDGKSLLNNKLVVLKSCFCQDAGYESIENGSLKVEKNKNKYRIDLEFETDRRLKVKSLQTIVEY